MVGGALGGREADRAVRAVLLCAVLVACAANRIPESLRGYEVVVAGRDEESVELARALREYGFRVRDQVRGGSRPTAALIHFTFSPGPGDPTWLHLRLADTRSGVIVRAGTLLLDSTTVVPRSRATAAVQALMAADPTLPNP